MDENEKMSILGWRPRTRAECRREAMLAAKDDPKNPKSPEETIKNDSEDARQPKSIRGKYTETKTRRPAKRRTTRKKAPKRKRKNSPVKEESQEDPDYLSENPPTPRKRTKTRRLEIQEPEAPPKLDRENHRCKDTKDKRTITEEEASQFRSLLKGITKELDAQYATQHKEAHRLLDSLKMATRNIVVKMANYLEETDNKHAPLVRIMNARKCKDIKALEIKDCDVVGEAVRRFIGNQNCNSLPALDVKKETVRDEVGNRNPMTDMEEAPPIKVEVENEMCDESTPPDLWETDTGMDEKENHVLPEVPKAEIKVEVTTEAEKEEGIIAGCLPTEETKFEGAVTDNKEVEEKKTVPEFLPEKIKVEVMAEDEEDGKEKFDCHSAPPDKLKVEASSNSEEEESVVSRFPAKEKLKIEVMVEEKNIVPHLPSVDKTKSGTGAEEEKTVASFSSTDKMKSEVFGEDEEEENIVDYFLSEDESKSETLQHDSEEAGEKDTIVPIPHTAEIKTEVDEDRTVTEELGQGAKPNPVSPTGTGCFLVSQPGSRAYQIDPAFLHTLEVEADKKSNKGDVVSDQEKRNWRRRRMKKEKKRPRPTVVVNESESGNESENESSSSCPSGNVSSSSSDESSSSGNHPNSVRG